MRPLQFGSTITVRLPDDTRALVEAAAEREDTSASAWIRKVLRAVASTSASNDDGGRPPPATPVALSAAA